MDGEGGSYDVGTIPQSPEESKMNVSERQPHEIGKGGKGSKKRGSGFRGLPECLIAHAYRPWVKFVLPLACYDDAYGNTFTSASTRLG